MSKKAKRGLMTILFILWTSVCFMTGMFCVSLSMNAAAGIISLCWMAMLYMYTNKLDKLRGR